MELWGERATTLREKGNLFRAIAYPISCTVFLISCASGVYDPKIRNWLIINATSVVVIVALSFVPSASQSAPPLLDTSSLGFMQKITWDKVYVEAGRGFVIVTLGLLAIFSAAIDFGSTNVSSDVFNKHKHLFNLVNRFKEAHQIALDVISGQAGESRLPIGWFIEVDGKEKCYWMGIEATSIRSIEGAIKAFLQDSPNSSTNGPSRISLECIVPPTTAQLNLLGAAIANFRDASGSSEVILDVYCLSQYRHNRARYRPAEFPAQVRVHIEDCNQNAIGEAAYLELMEVFQLIDSCIDKKMGADFWRSV
jgi:hypothetical protein